MRVHVIETGRVVFKEVLLDGPENLALNMLMALFSSKRTSIPIHAYVLEHPDGLIMIDTGLHAGATMPRLMRLIGNIPPIEPSEEVGPQMRSRGLRPEDVRWVIPTHLHIDHAGGVHHFPGAEILVHRRELEKPSWMQRAEPRHLLPEDPSVYELDPEPYHSFPAHKRLATDVRLVPTPGHSVGHVSVVVDTDGPTLFFAGDHCLTQDRFASDYASGRLKMLGMEARKFASETSHRIAAFVRAVPTVLVPAHDATVAHRLAAREPVAV